MSNYNQHQAPPVSAPPAQYTNPPLAQSYPVQAMHTSAYSAPPPAGYPTKDTAHTQQQVPTETRSRGDGFWKGWNKWYQCRMVKSTGTSVKGLIYWYQIGNGFTKCTIFAESSCAALCCCCLVDMCF